MAPGTANSCPAKLPCEILLYRICRAGREEINWRRYPLTVRLFDLAGGVARLALLHLKGSLPQPPVAARLFLAPGIQYRRQLHGQLLSGILCWIETAIAVMLN
jgi:hypothetical protein